MEWLAILQIAFKFLGLIIDLTTKTPQEQRRTALAALDRAVMKAKTQRDLSELSKWWGRQL